MIWELESHIKPLHITEKKKKKRWLKISRHEKRSKDYRRAASKFIRDGAWIGVGKVVTKKIGDVL